MQTIILIVPHLIGKVRNRMAIVGNERDGYRTMHHEADAYVCGYLPPRHPVPATEQTNAYALSYERVPILIKAMLLKR